MKHLIIFFLIIFTYQLPAQLITPKKHTTTSGTSYISYENSPLDCRIYTLKNGLTVFMNRNTNAPRIQTYIAVKAGSTYDPADNTGLAHYLEHLMFKGSDELGTTNWKEESKLLSQISDLYEKHKATNDTIEKKEIYAQIDSISHVAAQYAVPNEYDKITALIGAKNTNAYTTHERTVYINNIPSNELERFLILEKERFETISLRLFHTELETVYEEFNMNQDKDIRTAYYALLENLYPNHPIGMQTTIGKAEHLQNPSMVAIHNYFDTYYRPNNMAISLSGDLDFDKTIALVEKTFGTLEPGDIPDHNIPVGAVPDSAVTVDVYGNEVAFTMLAYRTEGAQSADVYKLHLLRNLLYNGKAGAIDLDIMNKQKLHYADCDYTLARDAGFIMFYAQPKADQNFEDAHALVFEEIEKIKSGNFEDQQLEAIINNMKLDRMKLYESNQLAHDFAESFANGVDWEAFLNFNTELESITKQDIIDYAGKIFTDNYVVINKHIGENKNRVKVRKPQITPLTINRDTVSEFYKKIDAIPTSSLKPEFIDFDKKIQKEALSSNVTFSYIKNEDNELFSLYYILDMGKENDSLLPLAVEYLKYLGTEKYSSDALAMELYRKALSFDVSTGEDMSYVYISGLQSSFDKGIELMEDIVAKCVADTAKYREYVASILKSRVDDKINKDVILRGGMVNYGKYGAQSSFTNRIDEQTLLSLDPQVLVDKIHSLLEYPHEIFYYGSAEMKAISKIIKKEHNCKPQKEIPVAKTYDYAEYSSPVVYFVDYDIVQANVLMLQKQNIYDQTELADINVFNNYFGAGMSSIVFQEIREAKGLAYVAYSYVAKAKKKDDNNFLVGFVGTSPDKLTEATDAMLELHADFPESDVNFQTSRQTILKQIESQRIIKQNIYFTYRRYKKLGIDHDIRRDIYEEVQNMQFPELEAYFNKHIKGNSFIYLVLGNKKDIDFEALEKLGKVKELSMEELFGY